MLPESWDESKTDFKGEVDGFKIEKGEGKGTKKFFSSRLPAPPLIFSLAFQDGGRDQRISEFPLQAPPPQANRQQCGEYTN